MSDLLRLMRLLPLLWRLTGKHPPARTEWFKGCSDADVQWIADQAAVVDGYAENAGTHSVYEARREMKRRGLR